MVYYEASPKTEGAVTAYLKALSLAGAGAITLAIICAPAEAGGYGNGPSWHQARKDAGNVAKAVHKAISSIQIQAAPSAGGGSKMTGDDDDIENILKEERERLHMTATMPYSGPTIEAESGTPAALFFYPEPCGTVMNNMHCPGPAETNPASQRAMRESR